MKTRALAQAHEKLGDLEKIIERLLKKKKKVRIFESGCGFGRVMMELQKKFGECVEIVGMNLMKEHGDVKKMISLAISEGIVAKRDLGKMKLPKIIYGDASVKLPFASGSIDLVYSQTSAYLYPDKLRFFEEVARVLSPSGFARITPPFSKREEEIPDELRKLMRIFEQGRELDVLTFLKRFRNIHILPLPNGRRVVEILPGKLQFHAELISAVDLHRISSKWFGMQSWYTLH